MKFLTPPVPSQRFCRIGCPALMVLLAAGGCGGEGPSIEGAERRDSAGVPVVVSDVAAVPHWTLANEPTLVIGATEGAEVQQLHMVRDPHRLDNGKVLLANAGTHEIRLYDAEGSLAWSTGREGEGPGEFRLVSWVRPYRGDSVAAYDSWLDRVTILDRHGSPGRTIRFTPLASSAPVVRPVDVFIDGTFAARVGEVSARPGDTTAVRRDRVPLARFDAEGRLLNVLDTLPDTEVFVWSEGRSRAERPRAFGRATVSSARGARLYAADNSAFQVAVLDTAGRVLGIFRAPVERKPLSASDREAWTRREIAAAAGSFLRDAREAQVRAMAFPDSLPYHGPLVAGNDGSVWLARWTRPGEAGEWVVFSPDGAVQATAVTPPGFTLTQVGVDFVVGVQRDALDVERVLVYPLHRGAP